MCTAARERARVGACTRVCAAPGPPRVHAPTCKSPRAQTGRRVGGCTCRARPGTRAETLAHACATGLGVTSVCVCVCLQWGPVTSLAPASGRLHARVHLAQWGLGATGSYWEHCAPPPRCHSGSGPQASRGRTQGTKGTSQGTGWPWGCWGTVGRFPRLWGGSQGCGDRVTPGGTEWRGTHIPWVTGEGTHTQCPSVPEWVPAVPGA